MSTNKPKQPRPITLRPDADQRRLLMRAAGHAKMSLADYCLTKAVGAAGCSHDIERAAEWADHLGAASPPETKLMPPYPATSPETIRERRAFLDETPQIEPLTSEQVRGLRKSHILPTPQPAKGNQLPGHTIVGHFNSAPDTVQRQFKLANFTDEERAAIAKELECFKRQPDMTRTPDY